jgi:hypothetical protein
MLFEGSTHMSTSVSQSVQNQINEAVLVAKERDKANAALALERKKHEDDARVASVVEYFIERFIDSVLKQSEREKWTAIKVAFAAEYALSLVSTSDVTNVPQGHKDVVAIVNSKFAYGAALNKNLPDNHLFGQRQPWFEAKYEEKQKIIEGLHKQSGPQVHVAPTARLQQSIAAASPELAALAQSATITDINDSKKPSTSRKPARKTDKVS